MVCNCNNCGPNCKCCKDDARACCNDQGCCKEEESKCCNGPCGSGCTCEKCKCN